MSPPQYLDNCIEIKDSKFAEKDTKEVRSNKAGNAIAAISKV